MKNDRGQALDFPPDSSYNKYRQTVNDPEDACEAGLIMKEV